MCQSTWRGHWGLQMKQRLLTPSVPCFELDESGSPLTMKYNQSIS